MKWITLYSIIAATTISISQAHADSGDALLQERCASCHDLTGPAAQTIEEAWLRKAPDLFYAGVKYKREWLSTWLTKPTRIRPMGHHYFKHVKSSPKGDLIDRNSLVKHPVLTVAESKKATAALLKLTASPVQLKQDEFNGKSISMSFGEMVFDKFNGCLACHQIEPGYGGVSGPEVYTAANRLQEDFLVSFIRSPQAWSPKSPMPNRHIKEANIQKLVGYLVALSKEEWK